MNIPPSAPRRLGLPRPLLTREELEMLLHDLEPRADEGPAAKGGAAPRKTRSAQLPPRASINRSR